MKDRAANNRHLHINYNKTDMSWREAETYPFVVYARQGRVEYNGSFKKSADDLLLCLMLCKTERHELYKLLACDFSDSRLMNE